jgi:hypothetical protein
MIASELNSYQSEKKITGNGGASQDQYYNSGARGIPQNRGGNHGGQQVIIEEEGGNS